MSDFDSEDLKQAKSVSNDFAPEDMQKAVSNAGPVSDFADTDLQHGMAITPPSRPVLHSEPVESHEVEGVAAKYKVDPEKLRSIAPFYGVNLAPRKSDGPAEALEYGAKSTAGEVGSMLLNAPQYVYKKLALEEPERQALDDLRQMSDERQSRLEGVTQFGRQVGVPAIGLPKALTAGKGVINGTARLAEASGIGAAAGTFGSREGEEGKAAKQGATLGLGFGLAGEALGKLLGPRASKGEVEAARGQQADIQKGVEDIASRTGESEDALQNIVFGHKETLTPAEAETIARQQLGDESFREYMVPQSPKGEMIRHQIEGSTTESAIVKQLAEDAVTNRARDFAEELTGTRPKTGEEALTAIQEHAARQGAEGTLDSYKNFVNLKQAERAIEEAGAVAKNQPGFFGQTLNKLSDNQYVLRHLDDKYGIQSEAALRDINRARNRLTFARQETRKDLGKIHETAVRNGTDGAVRDGSHIYKALDTGEAALLTPTEKETAQLFKDYFQKGREFVNGLVKERDPNISPLSVPKIENYVPHVALPVQDQIPLIETRIQQLEQQLGDRKISSLSAAEVEKLAATPGPLSDLVAFNNWADNSAGKIDGRKLVQSIEQKLHSREGNIALESRARAAMERTGEVPDFILEKNLYKLADSWAHNTYNHLYLRNGLEKLKNEARKLDALGASAEADYVNRIVQDSLGIRKGTAAEGFMQSKIGAARKMDSMIDQYGPRTPTGIALTAARNLPDVLYGLMRNIYPNLLGFGNLYAATQNLVTGFTRLAPELGTRYGYATVLRGTVKALLNFGEYYKVAERIGNVPADVIRHGEAAIAEGLFRSKAFNLTRDGYQKLAQFGMKFFEKSEQFNRVLTISVADMMAADLAKGSASALGSLRKFPQSIQKQVMRNPHNVEMNSKLLGQYLNDTTQFNYNRSSLFEFGRTLGPVLSTFSKWPTSILGEAAYTFRSKGLVGGAARNMERLVAPFLLLTAVQHGMNKALHVDSTDELPDAAKKLVGGHGLGAMAPMNALHGFVTGEIFTPPAVDFLMRGLIIPAFSGDTEKMGKGLDMALRNYAPGSGLLRFITDDMVTYITGHRPEGSTFIERTQEGIRKIEK